MASNNTITKVLGGKALPATIYMLVALLYFVCDYSHFNVTVLRILYVLYYALSLYFIIAAHKGIQSSRYLIALDAFVILVALYVMVDIGVNGLIPIGSGGNMDFFWWHFRSVIPIFPFYFFGKKNMISDRWFQYMFVFCFIVVYVAYTTNLQRLAEQDTLNRTEFTNNIGYYMVALLPMTALFKKKSILQFSCIGLVAVFTILSYKRGAVLCLTVALPLIIYKEVISNRETNLVNRLFLIILTIAGVILLYLFVMHLFEASDYFVDRIDNTLSGNTSGRDELFSYYWNTFLNSDAYHMFFGYGPRSTVRIFKFSEEAHNDWLEYIIDLGILGVLFYTLYWIAFIREYFSIRRKCKNEHVLAFGLILVIYFIRTFVSMSFYDMPFYSNIVLGYCLAMSCKKPFLSND